MISDNGFCHTAFVYADDDEYVGTLVPFIREGLEADNRVLVVVCPPKIDLLRDLLAADADAVEFENMLTVGRNPARIIPLWRQFLDAAAAEGRPVRGIGEPIHAQRSADEFAECVQHEALLNVAFDAGPGWPLICPYDAKSLTPAAIEAAHHTHPTVQRGRASYPNDAYSPGSELHHLAAPALRPVPEHASRMEVTAGNLHRIRRCVGENAVRAGLCGQRLEDFVLAVSEVATNSILHAGGSGLLRMWAEKHSLVCEVSDSGAIDDPLVGRKVPHNANPGGRGLWLANILCDLVQLRSDTNGSTVRLHISF